MSVDYTRLFDIHALIQARFVHICRFVILIWYISGLLEFVGLNSLIHIVCSQLEVSVALVWYISVSFTPVCLTHIDSRCLLTPVGLTL